MPDTLHVTHLSKESSSGNITEGRGAPLRDGDVAFFESHATELLPHGRRLVNFRFINVAPSPREPSCVELETGNSVISNR